MESYTQRGVSLHEWFLLCRLTRSYDCREWRTMIVCEDIGWNSQGQKRKLVARIFSAWRWHGDGLWLLCLAKMRFFGRSEWTPTFGKHITWSVVRIISNPASFNCTKTRGKWFGPNLCQCEQFNVRCWTVHLPRRVQRWRERDVCSHYWCAEVHHRCRRNTCGNRSANETAMPIAHC